MKITKKGFTLIELLIVVAIIAILAAIAIPNFLAAQVRAKVSRSKSDLRTMATALESYFVDNNSYPLMGLYSYEGGVCDIWGIADPTGLGTNEMFISQKTSITTPIAYITSEPYDPFYLSPKAISGSAADTPSMKRYCYSSYKAYQLGQKATDPVPEWHRPIFGEWRLWGSGPDNDRRDVYWSSLSSVIPYDPTNGVISNGDILTCPRSPDGQRPLAPGWVQ
jgi:prepilin-type N-terminal cleavage/methylation domain-containing protein